MKLERVPGDFVVCRLPPDSEWIPPSVSPFASATRTVDELSIVCETQFAPANSRVESGWKCFRVSGSIPFETIGLLASLTEPLADASISVFAISTFDTDYLMVKFENCDKAVSTLKAAGFSFAG